MKKYQKIALLFLLGLITLSSAKHTCGQSALGEYEIYTDGENDNNGKRNLQGRVWEPIRITLDFSGIEILQGSQPALYNQIKKVARMGADFYQDRLQVIRQSGNNKFPSYHQKCLSHYPTNSDKTVGIANSDLHIFINYFNDGNSDTIASAGPCILGGVDKRPNFGFAKFNLPQINSNDSHADFEDLFETTIHEFAHVLGFLENMYEYFINPATQKAFGAANKPLVRRTIRGLTTQVLITEKVKEFTRQFFGCSTAEGMQLENQTSSAHSHWETTLMPNDYMNPRSNGQDKNISAFTFKLLEDSGWYRPDYTGLDEQLWGKGQGCDFLTTCDGSRFREFNNRVNKCGFYYEGEGKPQYEPYSDGCIITQIYSNRVCSNPANEDSSQDDLLGRYYGSDSKCFESNIKDDRYTFSGLKDMRCLQYECRAGGNIDVVILGEKYSLDRNTNRVEVTPKGNNEHLIGYVSGPENWNDFCYNLPEPCLNYCSSNGFCMKKQCHCNEDYAGEDCSIYCPGGKYVYNNRCRSSKRCPYNTRLNVTTKVCERI